LLAENPVAGSQNIHNKILVMKTETLYNHNHEQEETTFHIYSVCQTQLDREEQGADHYHQRLYCACAGSRRGLPCYAFPAEAAGATFVKS